MHIYCTSHASARSQVRGVLEVQLQVGRVRRRAAGARQRRGARGGDDTLYFTLDSHGPGDSDSTHTAPLGGASLAGLAVALSAFAVCSHHVCGTNPHTIL